MISRIDHKGTSWIDAKSPSSEEIIALAKEFNLAEMVTEELLRASFRPKAENYGSHLYLILHLPLFDSRKYQHRSRELDIVMGKDFMITVHQDPIEPLLDIFKHLEMNLGLRDRYLGADSDKILHFLWKRLYEHLLSEIDHIQRKIDRVEDKIFAGKERDSIEGIASLRRDVLDFLRAVRPHGTVIESLEKIGEEFYGKNFLFGLSELTGQYRRLMNLTENNKDALETLYDTNNALLANRSTEVMKTFTMLALFTFPLTLIATIFTIDAVSRPIVGEPNDFWIIIGILFSVVLLMFAFFKYRRWI